MTQPNLQWVQRERSRDALLGKVRVFSLQWGIVRKSDTPWNLYCYLPGYASKVWPCADEAQAAARAAKIFARWLESTGLSQEPS